MLLSIALTADNATDLGYLLHKNPARHHSATLPFGTAHVFASEGTDRRCVMNLLVDIDPIAIVRRSRGDENFLLRPYVNDRPYVCSSFVSVAMTRMFASAMAGVCRDKPELALCAMPFEIELAALPCEGGKPLIERPDRLSTIESVVFALARPKVVIVTTPNAEHNAVFQARGGANMRHADHRFEWSRQEFSAWAASVCNRFGYAFEPHEIGAPHPDYGAPTQMGVFRLVAHDTQEPRA